MQTPRALLRYVALAYGISWLLWAPLWLPALGVHGVPVLPYQHAFGAYGPCIAALICASMDAGTLGRTDLLQRLRPTRQSARWLLIGALAPVLLLVAAVIVATITTRAPLSLAGIGRSQEFPQFSVMGVLLYNLLTFGIGEEVGWRGYALPRLQSTHSALTATCLSTLGWAGWHAPLFLYRAGFTGMGLAGAVGWIVSLVTGSVLLTWLYNESRGSVLVVALFHAAVDIAFTSAAATGAVASAAGVLITLCGLAVLFSCGPAFLARGGKVVLLQDRDLIQRFEPRAAHATNASARMP
jgi:uncharacterized protein